MDIDIALVLDRLIPGTKYFGSLTDNTREAFDNLRWKDTREKPSWDTIVNAWPVIAAELAREEKIQERIEKIKQHLEEAMYKRAENELIKEGLIT